MWLSLISVGNNNHDIFGTQEEFLNAHFVGYNQAPAGYYLREEQFTILNPWGGYTNHSWAKIPIRLNIS